MAEEAGESTEQLRCPQTSDSFSTTSDTDHTVFPRRGDRFSHLPPFRPSLGEMGQVAAKAARMHSSVPRILLHPLLIMEDGVPLVSLHRERGAVAVTGEQVVRTCSLFQN